MDYDNLFKCNSCSINDNLSVYSSGNLPDKRLAVTFIYLYSSRKQKQHGDWKYQILYYSEYDITKVFINRGGPSSDPNIKLSALITKLSGQPLNPSNVWQKLPTILVFS